MLVNLDELINIQWDRDCLLYMLNKTYGIKWQGETIRKKRISTRELFYEAVVKLGAKIAAADGTVDTKELDALKRHFKITSEILPQAGKIFNDSTRSTESPYKVAQSINQTFDDNGDIKKFVMYGLLQIALVDRSLSAAELEVLGEVRSGFGLTEADFEQILAMAGVASGEDGAPYSHSKAADPDTLLIHHLDVLGLKHSATQADIKAAYKIMAKRYHPDHLRAQGLPEGEIHRSEIIMRKLNASYNWLRDRHKIS